MSAEGWPTNWVGWTPLLAVWQVWHFQHLRFHLRGRHDTFRTFIDDHRCPRKLGDELGRMDAAAFYMACVTLSAPQARFAWQA